MMGLRKYARHRELRGLPGGTLRAVQVAIKTGRLSTSLTTDGKRIRSAAKADEEWVGSTKADMAPLTGPTGPQNGAAKPTNGAPPVNELAAARTRSEAAKAELAEIELAVKRGELISARDIEARLADVFLRCRTRLLGIPSRLREQDPTLSGKQVVLVEALIREALKELATGTVA